MCPKEKDKFRFVIEHVQRKKINLDLVENMSRGKRFRFGGECALEKRIKLDLVVIMFLVVK
jgi:hypothetical protein